MKQLFVINTVVTVSSALVPYNWCQEWDTNLRPKSGIQVASFCFTVVRCTGNLLLELCC